MQWYILKERIDRKIKYLQEFIGIIALSIDFWTTGSHNLILYQVGSFRMACPILNIGEPGSGNLYVFRQENTIIYSATGIRNDG